MARREIQKPEIGENKNHKLIECIVKKNDHMLINENINDVKNEMKIEIFDNSFIDDKTVSFQK